jgi:hypothetical protein
MSGSVQIWEAVKKSQMQTTQEMCDAAMIFRRQIRSTTRLRCVQYRTHAMSMKSFAQTRN